MADVGSIVAGANPYSAGIEAAGGVIQGVTTAITAAGQMKRAQALRDQANGLQPEAIRPEYLAAERNAQGDALYGLPALNAYQTQIGKNISASVRAIKESSPNGGATLAAIDNALASGNNSETDLAAKDAQAQEGKAQNANEMIWKVGDKQRQLQDIQDKQKMALQVQAGNLETASTANKQEAINTAITGVTKGASQAFKMDNSPNTTVTDTTAPTMSTNPYGSSRRDNVPLNSTNNGYQYNPWASY